MPEFPIEAVLLMKRLRGSSQAVLTRCSNDRYYCVKFINNPNGVRALANEVVTTRIAHYLGVPVPNYSFIYVSDWLISHSPYMVMLKDGEYVKYRSGVHFGSETPYSHGRQRQVLDYLPASYAGRVHDLHSFAGALALDAWTGNLGKRQAIFVRRDGVAKYDTLFIDHHLSLTVAEATESASVVPAYCHREFYDFVRGWGSFEPFLTKIEETNHSTVARFLIDFPDEWDISEEWRSRVADHLIKRRELVKSLIARLRFSPVALFRNWGAPWPPGATSAVRAEAGFTTLYQCAESQLDREEATI
jgi:hypothetical protein